MWPALHRQILARTKINNLRSQWILIDHDVIGLEVAVQDAELFIQVTHTAQYLLHNHLDLMLLVEPIRATTSPLPNILSQTHVHHFKNNVEPPILILNTLGLHYVGTVGSASTIQSGSLVRWRHRSLEGSLYVVKPLQYLYLPLLKGLFLSLKL